MKFFFSFFAFLVLFCALSGGPAKAQTSLKAANRLYDLTDYSRAIPAYKRLLKEGGPKVEVLEGLGNSYFKMNNHKEAALYYEQARALPKFSNVALIRYALAEQRNENYDKAKELFLKYGELDKERIDLVNKYVAACDMALTWKAEAESNTVPVAELQKAPFNSENSDFSPVYYKNGLLFSSDRARATKNPAGQYGWTGRSFLQLYTVPQDSLGNWGVPAALPNKINTSYHNATAAFFGKGDTLFFTRTNKEKVRRKNGNSDPTSWEPIPAKNIFVYRLEIYSSEFKGDAWSTAKPFAYNKMKQYSVGHPAFSADGNTMYFVSDMPGGFGETDLYYCAKQPDGTWGKPVNCGAAINTSGNETFPALAPNGTLYYSSDGHPGMGGLDIFSAEGGREQWSAVTNLKPPFNSGNDDFSIIFDPNSGGTSGFLSSNRNSENGADHIYSFGPPIPKCELAGKVIEQQVSGANPKTKVPGMANVKLALYKTNDTVPQITYSDAEGNFTFIIENGRPYTIKGFKEGYLTKSTDITSDCKSTVSMIRMINLNMPMIKDKANLSYLVENIYYDLNKYNIRPDAAKELDKLVVMLQDNPKTRIELSSHTDSRHSDGYNNLLSQLRAEAAVKYMVSRGIDASRMKAKGYGETRLLNRCKSGVKCSEKEHQLNRRTEFKLIR